MGLSKKKTHLGSLGGAGQRTLGSRGYEAEHRHGAKEANERGWEIKERNRRQ